MKKAIRYNLLLLRKTNPLTIVLVLLLISLLVFGGQVFFITIIPLISFFAIFTIEDFDSNKHTTLFSIPITRIEFAKSKFYSLLIINGAATFIVLIFYFALLNLFKVEFNILYFILELAITLPLSIFVGGVLIGINKDYIISIAMIYIVIVNFLVRNVINSDIDLQIGKDLLLDTIVFIIWLALSIASYIATKRSIIDKYTNMEL